MAEKDFQYYKKWALGVIKKQIAELDKEEKKNKKIAKAFSLAEIEIEKAFPVGTIRTWKGKKFIKSPDKKWRPYYEKNDTTGAKRTLSLLAKKINALDDGDFKGLYNLLKLHESRFLGQGNQLMEIYKLAKNKGANVGKRFSAAKKAKEKKIEPKKEEKKKDEPKKEEEIEEEKEKTEEERQEEIRRIARSIEDYHENIRKDMKLTFYESSKRTESERLTLANEAKVFDALYGKELRKKGLAIFGGRLVNHGEDEDDEEQEKWFQRVEEAIDFAENYQNMKNSDDAIDAIGLLCTGDFYLGQGDIFGDDKKSFTAKEKKNIEAYEAVSGEVLPEKKEDVVEYFKDKRKREPDWENNPPRTREERVKLAEKLAKKYGLTHPVIPKKEEEKKDEKPKDEVKKEPEKEETKKEGAEKEAKPKDKFLETEEYKEMNGFYKTKRRILAFNKRANCRKITEYKGSKDDLINIQSILGDYVTRESIKEAFEGLSEEDINALLSWIKKEAITSKVEKHHLWVHQGFDVFTKKKDSKDGWSAASIKDKYERESKTLGKIKFSEQCIRQAWESKTVVEQDWKDGKVFYDIFGDMGCRMSNGYMEKFEEATDENTGEVTDEEGEATVEGTTSKNLFTGHTRVVFGLSKTKEEVEQFERIKPRIAAIKRELGDKVIALHEDTKKFLKALYDAKVKDPNFKAYHDYDAFMLWRRDGNLDSNITVMTSEEEMADAMKHAPKEPRWRREKMNRYYGLGKSFCYFDKKGHLWIKKSALDAFMG